MEKKPLNFCSFGRWRLFCDAWWNDLSWYLVGISWTNSWNLDDKPWWKTLRWGLPGWLHDIKTFWHRARYGWAPRDTWSLDYYLNGVLAGALQYLADHNHGAPAGYGSADNVETNFEKWDSDLRRWAKTFSEDSNDVKIYDKPNYEKHWAEEKRRREAIHLALREIEPWWDSLWD